MPMASEILWTDADGRMVRETFFAADGSVSCVGERYEPKVPPPPPVDIAALKATVANATTVPQLRGAMMAYLDAVAAQQSQP